MKYIIYFTLSLVPIILGFNISEEGKSTSLILDDDEFYELFDDRNIGFMHLHASRYFPVENNFAFKGELIPTSYYSYLPVEMWEKIRSEETAPRAVFNIGLQGDDFFVLYTPDKNGGVITLCEKNNRGQLKIMKKLAYRNKGKNNIQLDTWFTDLNKDGFEDMIQVKRTESKKGYNYSKKVFLYNSDRRKFRIAKGYNINWDDYELEPFDS